MFRFSLSIKTLTVGAMIAALAGGMEEVFARISQKVLNPSYPRRTCEQGSLERRSWTGANGKATKKCLGGFGPDAKSFFLALQRVAKGRRLAMSRNINFASVMATLLLVVGVYSTAVSPASGAGIPETVSALEADVADLKQRVAVLENATQPLSLTVDCNAGETVNDALNLAGNRPGVVSIIIIGVCAEQVDILRDNTWLGGASAGDGIQAPSNFSALNIDGARHVHLNQLTLMGGDFGLSAGRGAEFEASDLVVTGAQFGVHLSFNSTGILINAVLDGNAEGIVVQDGGVLQVVGGVVDNSSEAVLVEGGHVSLQGTVVRNSGLRGLFAANGGSIMARDTIVENSADTGVQVNQGGSIVFERGTIRNNRSLGVAMHGSSGVFAGGASITDNASGIGLFNGSRVAFGDAIVRNNGDVGILLIGGSSIRPQNLLVENNASNGIVLVDTSVAEFDGTSQVINNGGWGIFCQPSPAVAQLSGPPGVVSGNGAGQVSCPGVLIP